jgi:two-component system sensor histidine kinase HydH
LLLAFAYLAVSAAYIVGSGALVAGIARDAEELAALERTKGIGFVLVTGALLFGGSWWALRRVRHHELEMARARELLFTAERQATAGLFVSSLAHDANNVAMVVLSTLDEVAARGDGDPELRQLARDGQDGLKRLLGLFAELKALGKPRGERVEVDVVRTTQRLLQLLGSLAPVRRCRVSTDLPRALQWRLHPSLFDQLLVNLVLNAAEAAGEGGQVQVAMRPERDELVIEVHDSGPGMGPEQEASLFKPFFTTKATGTGLGLVSVREAARAHGGAVHAGKSAVLGGACFTVRLGSGVAPGSARG